MGRKIVYVVVAAFLLSCVMPLAVSAQGPKEDLMKKLNDTRRQKADIARTYKTELDKVNKEADDKVEAIKKDFHEKRDKVLNEKAARQKELADTYKPQIKNLEKEEKALLEKIGPGEGSNFAKKK